MVDDRRSGGARSLRPDGGRGRAPRRFFASASAADWDEAEPVRRVGASATCSRTSPRREDYNQACLDGTRAAVPRRRRAPRARSTSRRRNEIGIREFDDRTPEQVLEIWRTRSAQNREAFRARDGGDVDSSVGAYPGALAGVPPRVRARRPTPTTSASRCTASEAAARNAWQARFGRFAIKELKPDLTIDAGDGRTHVKGDGVDIELPDEQFVQAVAARLPADSGIDAADRARPVGDAVTLARRTASSSPARPVRSRCPVALGLAADNHVDRGRALQATLALRDRLEAAGVQCISRRSRQGRARRRARRRRLRLQLRGRQEQQVGGRPRRATPRRPVC